MSNLKAHLVCISIFVTISASLLGFTLGFMFYPAIAHTALIVCAVICVLMYCGIFYGLFFEALKDGRL